MKLLALFPLFGCATDPAAQRFEPDTVTTGIYNVDVTTSSDSCTPQRFVGDATVPVFATPGAIAITDVGTADGSRQVQDLTVATGYALRVPTEGNHLEPCPPLADEVVFTYALTAASAEHLEVQQTETWTMAAACPGVTTVGASQSPETSCSAERTLTYDLLQACPQPCTVRSDLTCSCN